MSSCGITAGLKMPDRGEIAFAASCRTQRFPIECSLFSSGSAMRFFRIIDNVFRGMRHPSSHGPTALVVVA